MLSLYVHIPFCVSKCPYCGFYSTRYAPDLADRYLKALEHECSHRANELATGTVDTVYIGGGTPTVLSTEQLAALFGVLNSRVKLERETELTVEVNPGTASPAKFKALREMGCTRLSIGVQSLCDGVLSTLGRIHTAEQSRNAMKLAREEGFRNVGIDLMYAVPGQTDKDWNETLAEMLRYGPEHVSLYSLSVEEGTRYARDLREGKLMLPDDERAVRMYGEACSRLEHAGYEQYELSNFARPGFSCRHNLNYWDRGEYLGLGAGAWSFLSQQRRQNIADVGEYLRLLAEGLPVTSFEEILDHRQAESEHLFLALRTSKGVDLARFKERFGKVRFDALMGAVEANRAKGLFEMKERSIRLTGRGKMLANEAMTCLLP
jgi:oxygen-independent coproporphyrinogen-3 oxidase